MEIGSLNSGALAQSSQANTQQQVRRNEQEQLQASLESPSPQQNTPQSGQRIGSLIDVSV